MRKKIYYEGSKAYKVVDEDNKVVGYGADESQDKSPTPEDNRPQSDLPSMDDMLKKMIDKGEDQPASQEEMQESKKESNPMLHKYADVLRKKKGLN